MLSSAGFFSFIIIRNIISYFLGHSSLQSLISFFIIALFWYFIYINKHFYSNNLRPIPLTNDIIIVVLVIAYMIVRTQWEKLVAFFN